MAQVVVTGLTGVITLPNSGAQKLANISLNIGKELADVSSYGGNGWRERVNLLKDLSGQCGGFLVKGATGNSPYDLIDGAEGSMIVLFAPGCSITFNAVIGNVTVQGAYDGLNIVTFSFSKGSGTPTVAWVES